MVPKQEKRSVSIFQSDSVRDLLSMSSQRKWLFFLYAFVLILYLPEFIKSFEKIIGLSFFNDYSNFFFITIAVIGSFKFFLKSIRIIDIVFLSLIIFWHFYSAILFPKTAIYSVENADRFFYSCLPLFLVGLTFEAKQERMTFVIMSWLALFLTFISISVRGMGYDALGDEQDELMGVAYMLLPFTLILFWHAIESGGIVNIAVSILSAFFLFSLGTRGPVICLVFFVAAYVIIFKKFKRNNKIIKSAIVLFAVLVYLFSREIALSLSLIAKSMGLSTRVFDSYINDEFMNVLDDSVRDRYDLYSTVQDAMQDNFWGQGLYADRYLTMRGLYVHNFELEILCDFGWIFGMIILLLLLILIIKVLYRYQNTNTGVLFLIFFTSSIMQLQFSSSFLLTPILWFFLGMCFTLLRQKPEHQFKL